MFALLYHRVPSGVDAHAASAYSFNEVIQLDPSRPYPAFLLRLTTAPANIGKPYVCSESGRYVLAWLRLDNRAELLAQLGMHANSDVELLLAAYARWQDDCVRHLIGDFAFALYDPQRETVLLARDPVGARPLYYRLDEQLLAVSPAPAALLRLPGLSASHDMDWAARFLLQLSMSHDATAYREIHKLPPGHLALVSPDRVQMRSYFDWQDDAPASRRRDPRWVAAYRETLQQAVACRLHNTQNIGCENSGGIDSAAVTGLAAQLAGSEHLHTFGFAIQEQEASHILATSQMHNIQHNHVFTALASPADAEMDHLLDVLAYPAEHGIGIAHLPFYQLCQRLGVHTLLSGFGGDEVVSNPAHHLIHELIDEQDWRNLWQILPGNPLMRSLRLGKRLFSRVRTPKYNARLLTSMRQRWPFQPLRWEVVEQLGLQDQYLAETIYDAPYRRINDFVLQSRLAAGFVPTRLENCTLIAATYGVDYRWPLLDVRLIQQYLSTPSLEKYGPKGMGRYLHRRAMDGIAPPMVQWKPSKDMGSQSRLTQLSRLENRLEVAQKLLIELERLPASLGPLVDTPKLKQAAQSLPQLQGAPLTASVITLGRTTRSLQWLNRWLARTA